MSTSEEPLVTPASVDEVLAAIESVDLGASWREVAPSLRIALPRRRPLPDGLGEMPARKFPPGIHALLGLDIGPAMLFVCTEQLTRWGVSDERAFGQALDNVRARVTARSHFALVHERIADVPTVAFQSREGWASSLLLLPDELTRVLGERNGLILAPMRDLVMWLPLETEREFARFLLDEFAAVDMNALDLPPFALVDGHLTRAVGVPRSLRRGSRVN